MNGPRENELVSVDEMDLSGNLTGPTWVPTWLVDCGQGCEVGIVMDDHCYVVLAKDWHGSWKPTRHIPIEVARKLGEMER